MFSEKSNNNNVISLVNATRFWPKIYLYGTRIFYISLNGDENS